jgi:hypothetical protein
MIKLFNPLKRQKGGSQMEQNILGKVRNTHVSSSKPLVPLFEAISNSIDAIQEADEKDGLIEIEKGKHESA